MSDPLAMLDRMEIEAAREREAAMTALAERWERPFDDDYEPGPPLPPDPEDWVVGRLETTEPGPMLAAVLQFVDADRLSEHDLVLLLEAQGRMRSFLDAEMLDTVRRLSRVYEKWPGCESEEDVFHAVVAELRPALTLTRRAAEGLVHLAEDLCLRLPDVFEALRKGQIDIRKARIIRDALTVLDADTAREAASQILEIAPRSTTGQLAARLARLVIDIDPEGARDRYETRVDERQVHCDPDADGTARLVGERLPVDRANAAMRRIDRLARRLKAGGDPRPIDQIRADLYLAILNGETGSGEMGEGGVVDLRVDLATLAGLDEHAGEIPGWGPVVSDVARQITERQGGSEWRVGVYDRPGGGLVDVVTTKRRPNSEQRRWVESASPTCVYPGCRMPAVSCDINHEVAWKDEHRTTVGELGPLCRHDHVAHHRYGWELQREPDGGYTWTSPLGHIYTEPAQPP